MGLLRNVVRPSLAKRTVGGMPILLSMRTTFVAFTIGSLAWIPPVLLFHQEATQPMGWIYLILAGILLALMGIQFLKRSPLDLSTPDALASTYLRRFSKMLAMVDAPGLLGAVISIVTGWWIWYAIGLMATFALRSRIAPTRGRIAAEDLALRAEGRSHPLLEALMLPIDAVRNHDRARRAARKSREHVR